MKRYYLAIDIGASSGRHIVGWREDGEIKAKEVYRFPNGVQEQNGHLVWDVDALLSHVKAGIAAAKAEFPEIVSLSVDTWAVDYVLLRGEEEVRPVYAYRDSLTEAAIPKDGPSAGLAITTALVSELTGVPIRCDVAMTGEISLKGRALPIGGLKEKSMAAYKAGCSTVIIPAENSKDLQEIGEEVKAGVRFVPVDTFDQVLPIALEYMPTPTAREDKPAAVPVAKSKRADRPVAQ